MPCSTAWRVPPSRCWPAPKIRCCSGILRRGAPLAEMLQAKLKANHGFDVPRFGVKLKRYGDDPDVAASRHAADLKVQEFSARDVSRSTILVVDDVLYQGHSLARVQTYLVSRGVPLIRAAVLADRCCAVLPVRLDVVGVHLQVAPSDVVECNVPPYEETFKIEVLRPDVPGRHWTPTESTGYLEPPCPTSTSRSPVKAPP